MLINFTTEAFIEKPQNYSNLKFIQVETSIDGMAELIKKGHGFTSLYNVKNLVTKTKNKTVIIVAQRINTILNADQIIVLEEGKVVGKGTHEELIKTNETYKQIALSQLSAKELNLEDSNLRTEKNKLMGEGGKEHE